MTFTPKSWQNSPSTATPLDADALIDLESRLSAYSDSESGSGATTADLAAETSRAEAAEALLAPKASPTLTGTPIAPTATTGTNTTQIATTAFVTGAVASATAGVASFNGRTGTVTPTTGDYTVSQVTGAAPSASPTFTGTPVVPTAGAGTNTTQAASTAFTTDAIGTETTRAEAAEGLLAPTLSPTFTGTPIAPTASSGTSTTQIATTAFVADAVTSGTAGVASFNSRTGDVEPTTGDYTVSDVTGAAPLASPTFTGTPIVPTATAGTDTTQAASTEFTTGAVATETSRAETAEGLLAPKASPTFTGTVTIPTPTAGDSTTKAASTAFVAASFSPLIEHVDTIATSGSATTLPDVTSDTMHAVTLTAACTLTFPTAAAGKSFTLSLTQDSTGARLVTWPGTVQWPGGTAPTLTAAASKTDVLSFVCIDGTHWLGFVAGQNF